MNNELRDWLSQELNQRGWSHNELARRAGVAQSAVSGTLSGNRKAGTEFCVKVASALDEPPEKLLRLAGILPTSPLQDSQLQELIDLIKNLSPENRQDVLDYIRFRFQQEKQDKR